MNRRLEVGAIRPVNRQIDKIEDKKRNQLVCLPADFFFAVCLQVFIGPAEVFVPEKSVVGRQRRRVGRGEHQVFASVNESSLLLCIRSPQDKDQVLPFFCQYADGRIGECLPSVALVRASLMRPYGQRGVEHEHALFGPAGQVAGASCPISDLISLKIFCRDGGKGTPSLTEKHKP